MTQQDFSELIYKPETGAFYRTSNPAKEICNATSDGYNRFKYKGAKYLAHRVAWFIHYGEWPTGEIDHINGNRSDNRIANLRDVCKQSNIHNQTRPQKGNKSGFLGVMWDKQRNKWAARICLDGKRKRLGSFDTPEEAHKAYVIAKELFHPSAPVNSLEA